MPQPPAIYQPIAKPVIFATSDTGQKAECEDSGKVWQDGLCTDPPIAPETVTLTVQDSTPGYVSGDSYSPSASDGYNPNTPYNGYWACAGYAAYRRPDIGRFWGLPASWYYSASAEGRAVGEVPQIGAIAVLRYGSHASIVDGVGDGWVTITEVNYNGSIWPASRTTSASDWLYIY